MAPCPQPLTLNGGFYIGADVGYDMYQAEHEFTATEDPLVGDGLLVSDDPTLSASGWAGGLFAGYGMYFNDVWYLGAEVFGNWSGAETTHNLSAQTVSGSHNMTAQGEFSSDGNVGVDVIPGMKLNPATLAYVRLGYNWADLTAEDSNVVFDSVAQPNSSDSDWEGGFHWGVGIESAFYENWSVRAEYTYTSFDNLTTTYSTYENPSDNQFMVGLLYHFV